MRTGLCDPRWYRNWRGFHQSLHHAIGWFVLAHTDVGQNQWAFERRGRSPAHQGDAPFASSFASGAGFGAATHGLVARLCVQRKRFVLGARHALPHRAGRRFEAERNHLHPRRGLCRWRAQTRPFGPGDERHAGGDRGPQRQPAGKTQKQYARSACPWRRAVCAGRWRHEN